MRMPSTPMNVRDRKSDQHGTAAKSSPAAKGDKSGRIGGARNMGSEAQRTSMAKKMGGQPIKHVRGAAGYHKRNSRPGA